MIFIKKERLTDMLHVAAGFLLLTAGGILVDRWFYGEWTLNFWNYFEQNILLGRMSSFGTSPWWYYFREVFIQGIPPFSIVYILCVAIVFILDPKSLLTWTLLPFLLIHFILGHKEIRFLFPAIGLVPILIIRSFELVRVRWNRDLARIRWVKAFMVFFLAVNFIFLAIVAFKPADHGIAVYKAIYDHGKDPVTVYFTHENPYSGALEVNYYKRPGMVLVKIQSPGDIPGSLAGSSLFVSGNRNEAESLGGEAGLIYSTFPPWMLKFNFNNWLDRTRCWYLYELR
jgi:phosphatidylinositol glycan class B